MSQSLFASGNKEVKEDETVTVAESTAKYNKIDAKTAKEVFDTQSDFTIIDVRTPAEYESGYIANAINIPLDVIVDSVLEKYPNKDEMLYVYCRSGNRSSQAAKLLVKEGYTNVYDFGGVNTWSYGLVN
jgi:rhodanese-related sulfurtransferase